MHFCPLYRFMKGLITLAGIVVLVIVGFLIWGGDDTDLARDANGQNATTTDDFTGIGGAEDDFDPLEGFDNPGSSDGTGEDGIDYSVEGKG